MKNLRNWIEEALGKQMVWSPANVGIRGGRKYYVIHFIDGSSGDYYIDFDKKTIEEV